VADAEQPNIEAVLMSLKHELRRRILRVMSNEVPISPRQLADLLGELLSNVSYHIRVLADLGAVETAGKKKVRGATQHFYRWSLDAEWARKLLEETEDEPPDDQS
jgi:DNA-binding transcriptional ArsR family regulator